MRPAFVGQLDSFILGDDGHIPWEALSHDVYSHSKNVHALGTSHEKVVPSFYTAMVVASKIRRAMKRTHEERTFDTVKMFPPNVRSAKLTICLLQELGHVSKYGLVFQYAVAPGLSIDPKVSSLY